MHKLIIIPLILFSIASYAQENSSAEVQALKAQLQDLEKKVNDLQNSSTQTAPRGSLNYKGINIQFGGFLASETVYRSSNMESDIGTSYGKIPFQNTAAYNYPEFRGTERQSRFSLLAQGNVNPDTVLSGYYELDFLGTTPTANPNESNSFSPRTRNVYLNIDWNDSGWHILAGQNWSLVTLNTNGVTPRKELIPPTIDAQYAIGFDWARQWQLRVVKDWNKTFWAAISFENAQTTGVAGTLPTGTGNTYQLAGGNLFDTNPTTNMSINAYPDVIAKVAVETDFGHYEIYNVARNMQSKFGGTTAATQMSNQSLWTDAVGVGAIIPVLPKTLDLVLSGLTGQGVGRYGTTQLPDATYGSDGSLSALNGTDYLGQINWHAGHGWEAYVDYGQEQLAYNLGTGYGYGDGIVTSNAGCAVIGGTCAPQIKGLTQANVGFWWSFYEGNYGTVKVGAQYSHTTLITFNDSTGYNPTTTQDIVLTSLRYYPF